MPLMSMAEYARHRGVSKAAVNYAIRDGRITPTLDHAGKRVIDSDLADTQWSQNTAHDKRRNTSDSRSGIAPIEPQPIAAPPEPDSRSGTAPAPVQRRVEPVQTAFSPQSLNLPEKPELSVNGADNSYSTARAYKEHFLAKKAEQDFLEQAGKLVPVETIQREWNQIAANVRTKVLGIPSKAKQRIPDLTHDQFLAIDRLVRESLEDLSANQASDHE